MPGKRGPSVQLGLLTKSSEAALNAVQTFNNPLATFKSETFIVIMVVAWTYLLHAYYRNQGIEYRYFTQREKRKRFDRTKAGAYKYWELERCLNDSACPLDGPTQQNLRFLIGLRNEIEHHQSTGTDRSFSGRYLACCLNYEHHITKLFGDRFSLGAMAAFTLQFRDIALREGRDESVDPLPSNVAKYLQEFDATLTQDEFDSPHFRRKFLFVPIVTSKRGQADEVIEFIAAGSEMADSINEAYRQVLLKEVERPKHLPGEIVRVMQIEGFINFKMYHHTQLWKSLDGKNPGKGLGVMVANTWYWYDRWIEEVRRHCAENDGTYRSGLVA